MAISLLALGGAFPLIAGLLGLSGKNSRVLNATVQALFMVGGLAGALGAALFLWSSGRGAVPASVDPSSVFAFLPVGYFRIDTLSAFFLFIVNLGSAFSAWFAASYLPRYSSAYRFSWVNAATGLFVAGMSMTVGAGNVMVFLFAWELMSLSAYFLVIAERTEAALKAGLSYLAMTQVGAACLFAGFAVLSGGNLASSISGLGADGAASIAGFLLLFAGFAAKAGIFPLHEWLPAAHPQAPSNSSALMSGVMLKIALYGLLRVLMTVFGFSLPLWVALLVVALGLVTGFYGAVRAAAETDIKRALAWSSMENLGLMFAMSGTVVLLVAIGEAGAASFAFIAVLAFALNHAVFKTGLFMAAGAIVALVHTRDTDAMGGLARRYKAFSAVFLALAFAASALPPMGTFFAEWLFLQNISQGIFAASVPIALLIVAIISMFALVSGLAAFAFVKMFCVIFLSKPRSARAEAPEPLGAGLFAPIGAAAAMSFALALALPSILGMIWPSASGAFGDGLSLGVGSASVSPTGIAALFAGAAIVASCVRIFAKRKIKLTDTWGCGAPLDSRMEYTATGFAAPIRHFFRFAVLPWKKLSSERMAPDNRYMTANRLEHGITELAERYVYSYVHDAVNFFSSKVRRLQSGVVQFYLALIFVALVVTIIVAL